jgi:hypothetical protein
LLLFCVVNGAMLASAPHALADTPWFAATANTSISNGEGPGPAPRGTATADFNRDGKADLVTIGNFTSGNLLVTAGDGAGGFGTPSEIANTTQTQGLDAGDVNGDGNPDVIAMTTSDLKVELGDGHGSFTQSGDYPLTLGGQVEPLLVDLNGDGALDVVAPTFTSMQTLINNGHGTFTAGPSSQVSGASVLSGITIATLNHDGKADLFATDGSSGTTYALLGTGTGAFTVSGQLSASALVPEDVAAIDLNGDGISDVATIGSFSFSVTTALTDGSGHFVSSTVGTYQYSGPGPTSAAVADFNHDGKQDLVVSSLANPSAGDEMVLAGNGTTQMQKIGDFSVPAFPQNPVLADDNGDGKVDIVTVAPGAISFLRNTTS